MKKVIVASKNPVKIQATENAFRKLFPNTQFELTGAAAPSGVSDQPMSSIETLIGAKNRVNYLREKWPGADYWVGIEGGIDVQEKEMAAFAWIVIESKDFSGKSRTGSFYLPEKVARLVRDGIELGIANDMLFDKHNSKQNSGAIGLLTDDLIDRTGLYEHGVVLALVGFKNKALYQE